MSVCRRLSVMWMALAVCLLAINVQPAAAHESLPQALFERAEALYRQLEAVDPSGTSTSWDSVASAFREVADRYAADPLAAEALWRLAWIHRARAEDGDADERALEVAAYQQIVRRHPASPHAPEALFRLAAGAEGEAGARSATLYAQLLQQYPTTPQAALARNRLAEERRRLAARGDDAPGASRAVSGEGREGPSAAAAAPGPAGDLRRTARGPDAGPTVGPAATPGDVEPGSGDLEPVAATTLLRGVRHYSDSTHTRVVLDLDRPVSYSLGEASGPARLFLDLQGVALPDSLQGSTVRSGEHVVRVDGDAVQGVRVGVNRPGVVRVVLDLPKGGPHTLFTLDNPGQPFRIVVDVPTARVTSRINDRRRPAATESASVSRQLGLGVKRIVIDPGHGGQDPGAIGRSGITEKQVTLEVARMLAERFRQGGYEVLLTRDDDRTLSLQQRTEFANRSGADLFISVHVNAARNRDLRGFETYFLNLATDPTAQAVAVRENAGEQAGMGDLESVLASIVKNDFKEESSDLARSIQDSLVMQVSKGYEGVRDLGVKSAPFYVLVGARMPSVLVEMSFISNAEEESRLRTSSYRAQIADAILIGTQSYVEERRMTAQPGGGH